MGALAPPLGFKVSIARENFGQFHITWAILRQNFGQFHIFWVSLRQNFGQFHIHKTVSIAVEFQVILIWTEKPIAFLGKIQ